MDRQQKGILSSLPFSERTAAADVISGPQDQYLVGYKANEYLLRY